jgi:CubicO group peptidase (beta-lactamase class C family)
MTEPTVDMGLFTQAIEKRLTGYVVGFAGCIGRANEATPLPPIVGGQARTPASGKAVPVTSSTQFHIASDSKFLTGLAAVQLLDVVGKPLSLDSPMCSALPQNDPTWRITDSGVLAITFRELLSHTSGLPNEGDKGEPGDDYVSIRKYLTSTTGVLPAAPTPPPYGTPTPRYQRGYSNFGFALFRILLPAVNALQGAGPQVWKDDPSLDDTDRAKSFAEEYNRIVQANVFARAAVTSLPQTGTPANGDYAFSYLVENASMAGGDESGSGLPLIAGAAGWFASIDQLRPVLVSLNNGTQNILTAEQWLHMQGQYSQDTPNPVPSGFNDMGLGIDLVSNGGYRWVEKNGGWGDGVGDFTSSIAFFGSGPYYAALLVNSDMSDGPGTQGGWFYCSKCNGLYYGADSPNDNGGVCPAGGTHSHGGQYRVPLVTQAIPGKTVWHMCTSCLAFTSPMQAKPHLPPPPPAGRGGTPHPIPIPPDPPTQTRGNVCPASDSGHSLDPSQIYILAGPASGVLGPAEQQSDWKLCHKCGVLVFAGWEATCAATGLHDYATSISNTLGMVSGADTVLWDAFLASKS